MTAECLACTAGMSISEYCGSHLDTVGCEGMRLFDNTNLGSGYFRINSGARTKNYI